MDQFTSNFTEHKTKAKKRGYEIIRQSILYSLLTRGLIGMLDLFKIGYEITWPGSGFNIAYQTTITTITTKIPTPNTAFWVPRVDFSRPTSTLELNARRTFLSLEMKVQFHVLSRVVKTNHIEFR